MKRLILFVLLMQSGMAFAQLQKPVTWSYLSKKINKQEAEVYLKATIQNGWHIYSMQVSGGPIPTSFHFSPSKAYRLIGKTIAPTPLAKYDKVIQKKITFFEKEVVFKQRIKLLKPKVVVSGVLEFMVCSDKSCLPAEEVAFKIPVS
ncbi:protein-disulfide reductase DsbD domain-containing protein [Pedobacter xixiisoli]|uniref:Disulphide bond corrector protein DsbC n=1 Tax=Pedobacter xixiisoli TaxID=1476464 RepID=A0A286AEB6_9SPHI|nr:protein-disulfide reductase DsbD domain-containing protein [Pedobacter xixiisoli]SOD20244.1 Disulphide bond corrector protein DsbC [Pedobacter xixiisoli]